MSQEFDPESDMYIGTDTQGGIKIEGPYTPAKAISRGLSIKAMGNNFTYQTHAKNTGEAWLKIISVFINREKNRVG